MQSRWARVARGSWAAAFATFVAALSHTLAGGQLPSAFGVAASLLLSTVLCTALTARTLSWWRLVVSMGASQVLFHALFSGVGTPTAVEHSHDAMVMVADVASHDHSPMWLAHVLAGAVTILAFRYAERAFWSLGETAHLFFARLVAYFAPAGGVPMRVAPSYRAPLLPPIRELLSPMRHRGPPVECAAV